MAENEALSPVKQAETKLRAVVEDLRDAFIAAEVTGGDLKVAAATVLAKTLGRHLWSYMRASIAFDADECCAALGRELMVCLDAGATESERAAVLDSYLSDPKRARTLRKGFQEMMDVTTTTAWPCIAALVAKYWSEGRPFDGFFKEVAALLTECTPEDLEAIEVLLQRAHQFWADAKGRIELNYNRPPRSDITITQPNSLETSTEPLPVTVDPRRAIRLLATRGFGRDSGAIRDLRFEIRDYNADDCWELMRYVALRERADGI